MASSTFVTPALPANCLPFYYDVLDKDLAVNKLEEWSNANGGQVAMLLRFSTRTKHFVITHFPTTFAPHVELKFDNIEAIEYVVGKYLESCTPVLNPVITVNEPFKQLIVNIQQQLAQRVEKLQTEKLQLESKLNSTSYTHAIRSQHEDYLDTTPYDASHPLFTFEEFLLHTLKGRRPEVIAKEIAAAKKQLDRISAFHNSLSEAIVSAPTESKAEVEDRAATSAAVAAITSGLGTLVSNSRNIPGNSQSSISSPAVPAKKI